MRPTEGEASAYKSAEDKIKEVAARYLTLNVTGIDDKPGIQAAHEARMVCVKLRTSIEKTRKELKAPAKEYGERVDAEAKRLTAMIAPTEKCLENLLQDIATEQARIQMERENALFDERSKLVEEAGGIPLSRGQLVKMKDADFNQLLVDIKATTEIRKAREEQERIDAAERKRVADELAEANRIEADKLKAERDQLAKERAELQAEKDQLNKAEADRKAAEQAEADRIEAAKRAEQNAEATRIAEAKRLEREEALKPDREKLEEFAQQFERMQRPNIAIDQVRIIVTVAADAIRKIARELT